MVLKDSLANNGWPGQWRLWKGKGHGKCSNSLSHDLTSVEGILPDADGISINTIESTGLFGYVWSFVIISNVYRGTIIASTNGYASNLRFVKFPNRLIGRIVTIKVGDYGAQLFKAK
jgi:hypothetical protein